MLFRNSQNNVDPSRGFQDKYVANNAIYKNIGKTVTIGISIPKYFNCNVMLVGTDRLSLYPRFYMKEILTSELSQYFNICV